MIQRICPVCDQVMKSAHYCGTCRRWVKDPWVREVGYYLNERHPQNEKDCSYHEGNQGRDYQSRRDISRRGTSPTGTSWTGSRRPAAAQSKSHSGASKKNKNINLILVIIIAIYITYMLVSAGLAGSFQKSLFGSSGSGFEIHMGSYGEEAYEAAPEEPVYHELEDAAVIAAGEACSARGHFDIQGATLQQPLEEILGTLGYELEDCYKYSSNEIYDSGESWYDTVISMDLAWRENDTYQYIEINCDTATGDLHEVNVVMSDGPAAAAVAVAALKYMEEAGAIPQDQECSETVGEELKSKLLSGNNMYYTFGDVEISAFSHSDSYGIYISHTLD